MILKESVIQIVEDFLVASEYYLVDVKVTPDNNISIEIDSFDGVSVDFCAELNRHVESKLDRDQEDFELEVGSAGLTEPFKVRQQYEKNVGNEVEVLGKDGRKQTGILAMVNDEGFDLTVTKLVKPEGAKRKIATEETISYQFSEIKSTKYILRFK